MSDLLDLLRSRLARDGRIHAWQVRRTRTRELQSYLVRTQLESERRVESESAAIAVFVRHDGLQGSASIRILPGEEGAIAERIDSAVYMAGLGGDAPYDLPAAAPLPDVALYDPALNGENIRATSRSLLERWRAAASGNGGVRPSSAELFAGAVETEFENSAGCAARYEESRLSLLSILLAGAGDHETERIVWRENRRGADLDIEGAVRRSGTEAGDLLRAELPPTGRWPVLIDAGELHALFSPIIDQSSAESLYRKQSRFEVGAALPIGGAGGDRLTLASNAVVPYGLASYPFDEDGVPGQRTEIVRDGIFAVPWATKRFADYAGLEPTGSFANLEIACGDSPLEALRSDGRPLLHVLSFSWLAPDTEGGGFASEIRMGYWIEKGLVRPVKGGTVSGNLFAALGSARFAKEKVSIEEFIGPAGALFEGLSVSGT